MFLGGNKRICAKIIIFKICLGEKGEFGKETTIISGISVPFRDVGIFVCSFHCSSKEKSGNFLKYNFVYHQISFMLSVPYFRHKIFFLFLTKTLLVLYHFLQTRKYIEVSYVLDCQINKKHRTIKSIGLHKL